MLSEEIRMDIVFALKANNSVKKNILRVILGEIELMESRSGTKLNDEAIHKIIKKVIQSNEEVIKQCNGNDLLQLENDILSVYLPKTLSVDEIVNILSDELKEEITQSSDKKIVGKIIKFCKDKGFSVNGNDVNSAITKIVLLCTG